MKKIKVNDLNFSYYFFFLIYPKQTLPLGVDLLAGKNSIINGDQLTRLLKNLKNSAFHKETPDNHPVRNPVGSRPLQMQL